MTRSPRAPARWRWARRLVHPFGVPTALVSVVGDTIPDPDPSSREKSRPRRWEERLWGRGRLARPGVNVGTGETPAPPGRPFTGPDPTPDPAHETLLATLGGLERRLDGLVSAVEDLRERQLEQPEQPEQQASDARGDGLDRLQETLAALEKQVSRSGREQFKANALVETAIERLGAAEETLRDQARVTASDARREVVREIFPALDGLDEALRAARRLLEQDSIAPPLPRTSWWDRLMGQADDGQTQVETSAWRDDLRAWSVGLEFVRERLLAVLAATGIEPMPVEGQRFDARLHVALATVPAAEGLPAGTVATELRRGYFDGDRVLRYAEVAVARDPQQTGWQQGQQQDQNQNREGGQL